MKTYRGYIRKWVKPRWGSFYLDQIKAVDVEAWLRRLPIARSSRAKIRNILSILFNHACRYELFDRNPMRFVRQGAKRRHAPNVLTAAEIRALVDHLALRERTLVLVAASTGLRQSELFGLKWRDVDFQRGELSVVRSIVFGVVGWKLVGKRTQVFYNIEFATADNETISKSSGSCWENAFEKCATQIVEDAKVAARRIESSR